jgi:hypothetical protein
MASNFTPEERRHLCSRFAECPTRVERDALAAELGLTPGQLWNLWSRWHKLHLVVAAS